MKERFIKACQLNIIIGISLILTFWFVFQLEKELRKKEIKIEQERISITKIDKIIEERANKTLEEKIRENIENIEKAKSNKVVKVSTPSRKEIDNYLFQQCAKNNFDFYTISALIHIESNYKSQAISKTNDYGLMQINIGNHSWIQKSMGRKLDFLNPYNNIDAGLFMLDNYRNQLSQDYAGVELLKATLNSYNCGLTGWNKMGRPLDRAYSSKILSKAESLK